VESKFWNGISNVWALKILAAKTIKYHNKVNISYSKKKTVNYYWQELVLSGKYLPRLSDLLFNFNVNCKYWSQRISNSMANSKFNKTVILNCTVNFLDYLTDWKKSMAVQ
jgi:hypothetical protein